MVGYPRITYRLNFRHYYKRLIMIKTDKILIAIAYSLIYACVSVQTLYGTVAIVALITEYQMKQKL